ncbi:uncharacterized protein AB675_119 [Cyphellophora attinorum]|uniref:Uncharacterized protein n=1 Tax=Cyphellophora attinorum TaxID=1664694 RepID=A0A0N1NYY2_9EURO|nr:uncharacterized protein AB675_119 [Phialophora attinorum]KPI37765.1 hypothetical protein AB675_119 [Phialophora attinorum]
MKSFFTLPGGFGAGAVGSATYTAVTAVLEPEYYAVATACQYLAQSVGQVGGLAASGTILRSVLSKWLRKALQGRDDADTIIDQVLGNTSYIVRLTGELKGIVLKGYVISLGACHGLSTALNGIAFALAIGLAERRLS